MVLLLRRRRQLCVAFGDQGAPSGFPGGLSRPQLTVAVQLMWVFTRSTLHSTTGAPERSMHPVPHSGSGADGSAMWPMPQGPGIDLGIWLCRCHLQRHCPCCPSIQAERRCCAAQSQPCPEHSRWAYQRLNMTLTAPVESARCAVSKPCCTPSWLNPNLRAHGHVGAPQGGKSQRDPFSHSRGLVRAQPRLGALQRCQPGCTPLHNQAGSAASAGPPVQPPRGEHPSELPMQFSTCA